MILFKNLKVGEFFSYNGMIYEKVNEHQARSTRKIRKTWSLFIRF
jgi:hypothetical protein